MSHAKTIQNPYDDQCENETPWSGNIQGNEHLHCAGGVGGGTSSSGPYTDYYFWRSLKEPPPDDFPVCSPKWSPRNLVLYWLLLFLSQKEVPPPPPLHSECAPRPDVKTVHKTNGKQMISRSAQCRMRNAAKTFMKTIVEMKHSRVPISGGRKGL